MPMFKGQYVVYNVKPVCSHPQSGCVSTGGGLRLCTNPEHDEEADYKTLGPVWHDIAEWPKDKSDKSEGKRKWTPKQEEWCRYYKNVTGFEPTLATDRPFPEFARANIKWFEEWSSEGAKRIRQMLHKFGENSL